MRYDYPLTKKSVVVDVGGHVGDFAAEIAGKYDCEIWIFEPLQHFFKKVVERFGSNPDKILMFNSAVGATNGNAIFSIKGTMSGAFADSTDKEAVKVTAIGDIVLAMKGRKIDLLKINAEGGEFEILEAILDLNLASVFRNIQVQPHPVVPDCENRWMMIDTRLGHTHDLVYHADWCWSGYKLRE